MSKDKYFPQFNREKPIRKPEKLNPNGIPYLYPPPVCAVYCRVCKRATCFNDGYYHPKAAR